MINRKELIERISAEYGVTKSDTKLWFDAVIDILSKAVLEDEVKIRKFGNFELVKKKPKKAWDLHRNMPIVVPERYQLEFKPCAELLEAVKEIEVVD